MNLLQRILILEKLGKYLSGNDEEWMEAKERAFAENGWFLPEFIAHSVKNIVEQFLQKDKLEQWIVKYPLLKYENTNPKRVGIVMAGNIPLVGFHDFLCVFITGNKSIIKLSSKDSALMKHIVEKLIEWEPGLSGEINFEELLKGCDAYIATGSNNTSRYFDYYFGKYPHLFRRSRTSVALLTGNETDEDLKALAEDIFLYFGMGCRNITKLYVPEGYDFIRLLNGMKKYDSFADMNKFRNNYDYNLALHILNNKFYMSSASLLLVEDKNIFSPVSQLHYEFYTDKQTVVDDLVGNNTVQCIVGEGFNPFGQAQCPTIDQYADGEDTLQFLLSL
jgi:hypothetical protein